MQNRLLLLVVILLSLFSLFSLSLSQPSQECTPYACNFTYISHSSIKSSSPSFRLGLIVYNNNDNINNLNNVISTNTEGIVNFASYLINNNSSLIPNVNLEIYTRGASGKEDTLSSAIALFQIANIDVLITLAKEEDTISLGEISSVYSKPVISLNSVSEKYSVKTSAPFLFRMSSPNQYLASSMLKLISQFNKTGVFYVYTANEFGVAANEELIKQSSLFNIKVNSIPISPTTVTSNILSIVDEYIGSECNTFIVNVDPYQSIDIMDFFNNNNLIGNDYLYFVTNSVYDVIAAAGSWNLLKGAFGFASRNINEENSIEYQNFLQQWRTANTTEFPGSRPIPSGVVAVDAVYAVARALQNAMGSSPTLPSSPSLFSSLRGVQFTGVTGPVSFGQTTNDRFGGVYQITNFVNGPVAVGTYSTVTDQITISQAFQFFDATSEVPTIPTFYCGIGPSSRNYTKTGEIDTNNNKCICNEGYTGNRCEVAIIIKHDKSGITSATMVAIIVPIFGALALILVAGFLYYRKRSEALVQDLAVRQRSAIVRKDLKLTDRIGRGATGEVYKAMFRGTEVAVKRLITTNTNKQAVDEFKLETQIMCGLRHPNIVLFMGSCFDAEAKEMLLVMEYHSKGSLHDVLHNMNISVPIEMQIHIAYQAAQGMNYLHESHPPIIHRDLKSQNILLDDKWNARISDFGITRIKEINNKNNNNNMNEEKRSKSIGTIFWTSPEVLDGQRCTEKSDCYAFGIVLWEMFHRQDPYNGKDPMNVAVEVIQKELRPVIDVNVSPAMQDLMQDCWAQDPDDRPTFMQIMERLRVLAIQHPVYNFGTHESNRNEAPTGNVFFVSTQVQSLFVLYDVCPRALQSALMMLHHLLRSNLELYNGYEIRSESFVQTIAFASLEKAMNWCISVQISLLNVLWPSEILATPWACTEVTGKGQVIWSGLRVDMCMHSGTPITELDPSTNRVNYSGAVMDRLKLLHDVMSGGGIAGSTAVMAEMDLQKPRFMEEVKELRRGKNADSALTYMLPESLMARSHPTAGYAARAELTTDSGDVINSIEDLDENEESKNNDNENNKENNEKKNNKNEKSGKAPSWIVKWAGVTVKEHILRGPIGDFYKVAYDGKEMAAKVLVNQKIREEDLVRLIGDASLLSKVKHENLLPFYGICIDPTHVSIFTEYVENGNLRNLLSNSMVELTFRRKLLIAMDIVHGMQHLSKHPDLDIKVHDNMKSNNIMIGRDFKAYVADFGQANIRELSRTSNVSNVSWTAPEILSGEKGTVAAAVYSFAIILWELFTRGNPYEGEHPVKVVSKILAGRRPTMPTNCPPNFQQLMESCWNANPDMRPSWHVVESELSHMLEEEEVNE